MKDIYIAAAAQIVSQTKRPIVKGTADVIDMQAMAAHVVSMARALEDKFNVLEEHEERSERLDSLAVWNLLGS